MEVVLTLVVAGLIRRCILALIARSLVCIDRDGLLDWFGLLYLEGLELVFFARDSPSTDIPFTPALVFFAYDGLVWHALLAMCLA